MDRAQETTLKAIQDLFTSGAHVIKVAYNLDRAETSLTTTTLTYTTSISDKWKIIQVLGHAAGGITETLNVYFNSLTADTYDTLIGAADFDGEEDVALIAGDNLYGVSGEDGDEITAVRTNVNGAGTIYLTIL